jgi:hypothetical protein
VDKVAVDIQQAGAIVGFVSDVGIPDFVIKRFGGHVSSPVIVVWGVSYQARPEINRGRIEL